MRWGPAITATLMITTKAMPETNRPSVDAEKHPNICSQQTQNQEDGTKEKKNQTLIMNWVKPTTTRCWLRTGNPDREEIDRGGQITELVQGRTGRGQHNPLILTTEVKKDRMTLQPMTLAVLISLAWLHGALGLMTLILTTRRRQDSSSGRRHNRRTGQ